MLATSSSLVFQDYLFAALVLLAFVVLERLVVPQVPWLLWGICFGVFLFGFALTVTW